MKREIAAKWCDALRSGEYQQAPQQLRVYGTDVDGFCCLGVLCDLYAKERPDEGRWDGDLFRAGLSVGSTHLPRDVQEWAGMSSDCGSRDGDPLTDLNDNGATFASIADLIERECESL